MERLRSALVQVADGLNEDELMIEGASLMFRQQEFRDVLRMEQMLAALIEGNVLSHVLRQLGEPQRVSVVIGPESNTSLLDDCSIVTHRYQAGSKGWGYIGVLGPTRMRYDRAVAAVELTARALSSVLSRTSFA
jgi:heat-inducible transcriptional repressor